MAMKKVVKATNSVQLEPMQAFKLQSLGLVQLDGNDVKPWCSLYARYFCDRLS
jgi:serine/threonine-protein kinase